MAFDNPQVKSFFCGKEGWDILPAVLAMSFWSFCKKHPQYLVFMDELLVPFALCEVFWFPLFYSFVFLCFLNFFLPSSLPPSFPTPLFLYVFTFGILCSEFRVSECNLRALYGTFPSSLLACFDKRFQLF